MDSDLGAMLESVLSDPAQMEKIAHMAQSIMGGELPTKGPEERISSENKNAGTESQDGTSVLSTLGKVFGGKRSQNRSTQLLLAMRPYMRPEKQQKLDRAIKIAEMVHIAGAVMKEYGGDFFGSV